MPRKSSRGPAARRVKVANAIDEHERVRKNSDDPAELERADSALKHAVDELVSATAADEYVREDDDKRRSGRRKVPRPR